MSTTPIATSNLGAAASGLPDPGTSGGIVPAAQQAVASTQSAPTQPNAPTQPAPAQGSSRLSRIIQAVAGVADTALAGIPDRGRPSFATGLGEGARAEQQAVANQQAIKFKTFDDQLRAAQLHNQDLELQGHTQEQQDKHQAAQDAQHDWDEAHGVQYDEIPNSGDAATNYLKAQSGNGGASIPPGTHLSADGKTILIPKQNDATQAAQMQKYNTFATAYGLPSLPDGAQFLPGKYVDFLQNRLEGHKLDGSVYNHDELPGAIADLQSTRDSLAKKGDTSSDVLNQLDGTIGSMQAKLDYLDNHKAQVLKQTSQATAAGKIAGETSPDAIAGAAKKAGAVANAELPSKITLQDNSAANKAQAASTELGYAYDPKSDTTVAVTADQAKQQGLQAFRKVNQTQISGDTHNASVLNDVSSKTNAVAQAAPALDQNGRQRDIISWALGDNGIKIGFGDHLALPMDALVNNSLNSRNMGQATDLTKQYIIGVLSLREAAMGMNRVLTGSARASESQIKALQATLPGYEPDSKTALQRLQSFGQNVDNLRKPIPRIPGVPVVPININGSSQQQRPTIPPMRGTNLGQIVSNQ